jgi:hypothetical protein
MSVEREAMINYLLRQCDGYTATIQQLTAENTSLKKQLESGKQQDVPTEPGK